MYLIEKFLIDLNSTKSVSKSTSDIYLSDLKQLKDFFLNKDLKDFKDFKDLKDSEELKDKFKLDQLNKRDISIYFDDLKNKFKLKTVQRKMSVIKNFYNYLIKTGIISINPLDDIVLQHISKKDNNIEAPKTKILSEDDYLNILNLFFNSEDWHNSFQSYLITKLIMETDIDITNIFKIKTPDLIKYEFKQIIYKKKNKLHTEELSSKLSDELKDFYNAFKDLYASNIEAENLEFFSLSLVDYRKILSEKGKILNININPRDFKNIKNIKDEHIFEKIKEKYFQIGIGDD